CQHPQDCVRLQRYQRSDPAISECVRRNRMDSRVKNLLFWVVVGLFMILLFNLFSVPTHAPEEDVIFSDFMAQLDKGEVTKVIIKRSEEHTSELQSRGHLVCRLLLEKKKIMIIHSTSYINNTIV